MQKINDLQELLKHELNDLYSAEVQLIEALPKMAEKATNPKLKAAIKEHLAVTKNQKKRLDEMRKLLKMDTSKKKGFWGSLFSSEDEEHCRAMKGLVREAKAIMRAEMDPDVMDAAIIAAAQKIEHYEISSYGTAKAFALKLKLGTVAKLLDETLSEEYNADTSLNELALAEVNDKAEGKGKKSTGNKAEVEDEKVPAVKKSPAAKKAATAKKPPAAKKGGSKEGPRQTREKSSRTWAGSGDGGVASILYPSPGGPYFPVVRKR